MINSFKILIKGLMVLKLNNCYLCGKVLKDGDVSEEHILLNALGGHLKSKYLICKSCNSTYGEKSDSALAKQLSLVANILQINRDRKGSNPDIRMKENKTGDEYVIPQNEEPHLLHNIVNIDKNEKTVQISGKFINHKELEKFAQNVSRKYPELSSELIISASQPIIGPLTLENKFTFFGNDVFPSILKTAINQYINITNNSEPIKNAIHILKSYMTGTDQEIDIVQPLILETPIYQGQENNIYHSIYMKGEKGKKLFCIVQYFNFYNVLVKLEDNYTGNDIENLYVWNVISREEEHKRISFHLNAEELFEYKYANIENEKFKVLQEQFINVIKIRQKIEEKKIHNTIIKDSKEVLIKYFPFKSEDELNNLAEQIINELFEKGII